MSRARHFISSLEELYKKLLNPKNEEESIEYTNTVDSFFKDLEREAAENRKRISDLGFWTEDGEYKEDYQEVNEYDL